MALSINEGTKQEVMELFNMPAGFKAGYVNIKHVEVQYPNSMVIVVVGKYASEEARNANEDNCLMEGIGFPATLELMEAIKTSDNRDVCYPYIKAQVQYLALDSPQESEFADETDEEGNIITSKETLYNEAKQAYNDKVQAIYDELSLENPYQE
jgi:hypothetical protein